MKKIVNKLGISVLALLLVTVGTAMADGGSSYSSAEVIDVPYHDYKLFGPHVRGPPGGTTGDWYQFDTKTATVGYVDITAEFVTGVANGALYLHDDYEGDITAKITRSESDYYGTISQPPKPRVQITGKPGGKYDFIVGLLA